MGLLEDIPRSMSRFPEPMNKEAEIPGLGVTYRKAAQTLGTEWGRSLNPDFWVLLAKRRFERRAVPVTIIPDVRFENEAAFIRQHGVVVHVDGPSHRALSASEQAHPSEYGIDRDPWDIVFQNTGTLEDLQDMVESLLLDLGFPLVGLDKGV